MARRRLSERLSAGFEVTLDLEHGADAGANTLGDLAPGQVLVIAEAHNLVAAEDESRPAHVLSPGPGSRLSRLDGIRFLGVLHLGIPGLYGPEQLSHGGADGARLRLHRDH